MLRPVVVEEHSALESLVADELQTEAHLVPDRLVMRKETRRLSYRPLISCVF